MRAGLILSLGFFVTMATSNAMAQNEFQPSGEKIDKSCLFKSPLTIGASVTRATAMSIPLYHSAIATMTWARGRAFAQPFGPGPADILFQVYGKRYGHVPSLAIGMTNQRAHLGSSQIRTLVEGKNRNLFDQSSIIVGVDGFYWDAIWGNCESSTSSGWTAEKAIRKLVAAAETQNKTLILGNVPHENPERVLIDSERLGVPGLWYLPQYACVDSINATLEAECKVERGCYLLDMDDRVQRLLNGEKLQLNNGVAYDYLDIRPDGVHLSVNGSRYAAEEMVRLLESHPPKACIEPR